MKLSTLSEWLDWISSVHFTNIDLGLDRITAVAERLKLLPLQARTIVVGGTNGKGSTVAALESIYRKAGYNVGCFTSPILFIHNEEVRINGALPSDQAFCEAFEKIETARGDITLTPFEYHTLAALLLFQGHPLDVLILEVGMGGRLDAVNIIDGDAAIVTSIAIDHAQWLGNTREAIAFEKAGIFRANKPAICGDIDPPATLLSAAKNLHAKLTLQGKDFHYETQPQHWNWHSKQTHLHELPHNSLLIQNMSSALMAVDELQESLPVSEQTIRQGLANLVLPGRMQMIEQPVKQIFDVSHNPAAVSMLAKQVSAMTPVKVLAVFSMLEDKDIEETVKQIKDLVNEWYIAPLHTPRAASCERLESALQKAHAANINVANNIAEAYRQAIASAQPQDLILIFGSFHTVAEAWNAAEL